MLYALTQGGVEFNNKTLACFIVLAIIAIVIMVKVNKED